MNEKPILKIKKKYKAVEGQRFTLTVHGASEYDLDALKSYFNSEVITLAVVAREAGRQQIHPHWQCYFESDKRISVTEKLRDVLGHRNMHVEVARGTLEANLKYVFAVSRDKDYEVGWIVYRKNIIDPIEHSWKLKAGAARFIDPILKPWQEQIWYIVSGEPDTRSLYWFYEPVGNTGKSFMTKYLHLMKGAIVTGGGAADMKHAVARWSEICGHYPVVILVDIARSDRPNAYSYKALEALKNGIFFTGKYESAMVNSYSAPHIIVFSNFKPNWTHLSADRWKVFEIIEEVAILKPFNS